MKTIIVANPAAASFRVGRAWPTIEAAILDSLGDCDVMMTTPEQGATACVEAALAKGAEQLVVVGGDGTLGQAINGLPFNNNPSDTGGFPRIVYLPSGTGGDFARSSGLSGMGIREIISSGEPCAIDVGKIRFGDEKVRYFMNETSAGASALVVEKVNQTTKKLGGRLSFAIGTLKALKEWSGRRIRVKVDDHFDEELPMTVVAVTNGRYFGGGMKIAPDARLDDGLLDVVAVKDAGVATFLRHGPKLYAGKHLNLSLVTTVRGKRVTLESEKGTSLPVEADGESAGNLPVTVEILPGAIQLLLPATRAEGIQGP